MAETMIIAVSGSTGLVGSALVAALEADGHTVKRLVRHKPVETADIYWNIEKQEIDTAALADVDAVVHLAAENIASKRWTASVKERIRASRTDGTQLIAKALATLDPTPAVFAAASAIGYYGDRGDELMTESSPVGRGFLADVCCAWEAATVPAADAGIRVVNMRIGVVQSRQGGALSRMLTPFRFGVGGVVGNGRQVVSWIEENDLTRAILFLLARADLFGPINLVAPQPVTNRDYTKTLGAVLRRPTIFPMPVFAARLAFGQMADELLLASTRVSSARLVDEGFCFECPDLRSALERLL